MPDAWTWPGGARCAVSLTFDADAESGFLGDGEQYARRLTTLSEGASASSAGCRGSSPCCAATGCAPRSSCPATPPSSTRRRCSTSSTAGHEIGHHGYIHLRSDKVSAAAQREEIERGFAALEEAGAPRPRATARPPGS